MKKILLIFVFAGVAAAIVSTINGCANSNGVGPSASGTTSTFTIPTINP